MLGIRSGLTRSTLAAGAAVLLTAPLMVGITPAAAAGAPKATTYTAVASWTPSTPGGPNVSLQVTEQINATNSFLFFFVNENYCVGNTAVFLSYFESGPQTELFTVAHNLSSAVLGAPSIEGTYTEQTAPECDTNGSDVSTVFSVTAPVSVVGRWTATGPASLGFPGEVVRPAAASVAMSGPPALGLSRLGTPSFAQLSSVTS